MITRHPLAFVATFALLFAVLQVAFLQAAGTAVERLLIDTATVKVAAGIIGQVDPAAEVVAVGHRLVAPTARLSVLRGCEGTELYFLWIAAVLAFPTSWRNRLAGLAAGLAFAFVLNQLRVIGLFYVVRDHRPAFELLHGYVAPGLLVLLLGLLFWSWSARAARA